MAKLPPKPSAPFTGKHLPQNPTPPANIFSQAASRTGGGNSSGGSPQEMDWTERLDPGQLFFGNRCLEGMYRRLFDDPNLYRAYFAPRPMPRVTLAAETTEGESRYKEFPEIVPMALTLRCANQAANSCLVKPHEQPLVHLAAIVSPCGLLMATADTDDPADAGSASWDKISLLRTHMLFKPLIKIKAFDVGMGNTLAAVLGQTYEQDDVDFEQVTRLATVVRLSDTKLTSYLGKKITSTTGSAI